MYNYWLTPDKNLFFVNSTINKHCIVEKLDKLGKQNFWVIILMSVLFQDTNNLEGSPRHSLGSNNSSNLSTPPSPAREMGSSSYES